MNATADLTAHEQLARDLDAVCHLYGQFTLRSGRVATEYFDKYLFEARPDLLERVARQMVPLLPPHAEVLGGLELGGIPIVTELSRLTGLPSRFVRKQPKSYGTRRLAEGGDVDGRRVTLIEDVVTTGGAVRQAALGLRERGAEVTEVVCAIDRSGSGPDPLADVGLETRALFRRADLDRWAGPKR